LGSTTFVGSGQLGQSLLAIFFFPTSLVGTHRSDRLATHD
jgi:hypothetical protein